jgi:hypothetical protein
MLAGFLFVRAERLATRNRARHRPGCSASFALARVVDPTTPVSLAEFRRAASDEPRRRRAPAPWKVRHERFVN